MKAKRILTGVAVALAVTIAVAAIIASLELAGARRFRRFCGYPNRDALLAAEAQSVVRCAVCETGGTNVTIVDMGWLGFLPSGAAMLVYDADGKRIDQTDDEGEDGRFRRKWGEAWRNATRIRH